MSDTNDLEKRLAALEGGSSAAAAKKKPSLAMAAAGAAGIALLGGFTYLSLQGDGEASLSTAQPEEFQTEGQGFGEIDPFVPPPPEPEIQIVETQVEPNAELLAQLAALQAQIEAIKNAPEPEAEDNTAAAEAMQALSEQIAALQQSSEAAQQQFQDALTERDRELEKLRMDLELAQLQA
ncbi:MAG: conjugal transfer protein, partial [Sulfitobacter sp.]